MKKKWIIVLVLLMLALAAENTYFAFYANSNKQAAIQNFHKYQNQLNKTPLEQILEVEPIQIIQTPKCNAAFQNHTVCKQTTDDFDRYTIITQSCYWKKYAYLQQILVENRGTLLDDWDFNMLLTNSKTYLLNDPLHTSGGFEVTYYEGGVQRFGDIEPTTIFKVGNKPKNIPKLVYTKPVGEDSWS